MLDYDMMEEFIRAFKGDIMVMIDALDKTTMLTQDGDEIKEEIIDRLYGELQ